MQPMRTDLLTALCEFLDKFEVTNKRGFNMWNWAIERVERDNGVEVSCGTSACAMGWAVLEIPAFKEAGFRLNWELSTSNSKGGCIYFDPPGESTSDMPAELIEELSDFHAISRGLGISYESANTLFNPSRYPSIISTKLVADRIRSFVEFNNPKAVWNHFAAGWTVPD